MALKKMSPALSRVALLAGVLSLGMGAMAGAQPVKEGPFGGLSGSWSGTGSIAVSNGANERIRCRASYSVTPSGEALHQELRCASDSYKFEVSSNVLASEDGDLSGTWTENTRQVTGAVSGRVTPGQIQTVVNGTGFSASLLVSTKGNRQAVSIRPEGTDIRSIDIDMRRG
jgi:hypothetical protein